MESHKLCHESLSQSAVHLSYDSQLMHGLEAERVNLVKDFLGGLHDLLPAGSSLCGGMLVLLEVPSLLWLRCLCYPWTLLGPGPISRLPTVTEIPPIW